MRGLLLVGFIALAFNALMASSIRVCESCDIKKLEHAVSISKAGDTIVVENGPHLCIEIYRDFLRRDHPEKRYNQKEPKTRYAQVFFHNSEAIGFSLHKDPNYILSLLACSS